MKISNLEFNGKISTPTQPATIMFVGRLRLDATMLSLLLSFIISVLFVSDAQDLAPFSNCHCECGGLAFTTPVVSAAFCSPEACSSSNPKICLESVTQSAWTIKPAKAHSKENRLRGSADANGCYSGSTDCGSTRTCGTSTACCPQGVVSNF